MDSVIVSDFGVVLGKTSERLVVRGPRPRLELVDGGPQLLLPLDLQSPRLPLRVVTSSGVKAPPEPLRRPRAPGVPRARRAPGANEAPGVAGANEAPGVAGANEAPGAAGANDASGGPHPAQAHPAQARPAQARPAQARPAQAKPEQVELPLFRISEIIIASSGVSLSTDLVEACCERGIRLSFLTRGGRPIAMLSSPMLTATVQTRREQMAAYGDARGLALAKAIARGKLGNQAALLKYFGKYLKEADPLTFEQVAGAARAIEDGRRQVDGVPGSCIDEARGALLAIEGAAGRSYWIGVRALLAGRAEFETREHRGAADPINAALNYGYGILYTQVWGAVMNAGLEPFAGFLHVDRPGKPSLVLDLVEEFRQPIVDRAVIAAATKGARPQTREGMLTDESRRAVAAAVLERLEGEVVFRGRRHRLKSVIQIQARNVSGFFRGGEPYRAFAFKW